MQLRTATLDDADAISALLRALAPRLLDDPDSEAARPFLQSLAAEAVRERLACPRHATWVAVDASVLCGVLVLRDGRHLYHLFVRADRQRRGIAHALWAAMLAHLPCPSAESDAPEGITVNAAPAALRFYQGLGFLATDALQYRQGTRFVPMRWRRPR